MVMSIQINYQSFEAVLKERRHRTIQMALDALHGVSLVGVNLLLEQDATLCERFCQNHALLKVNVIVGSAVN